MKKPMTEARGRQMREGPAAANGDGEAAEGGVEEEVEDRGGSPGIFGRSVSWGPARHHNKTSFI